MSDKKEKTGREGKKAGAECGGCLEPSLLSGFLHSISWTNGAGGGHGGAETSAHPQVGPG